MKNVPLGPVIAERTLIATDSGEQLVLTVGTPQAVAGGDWLCPYRKPGVRAQVVCIEVKHAERWQRKWERPMRDMVADERLETSRMIGVYRGARRYHVDAPDVLPVRDFLWRNWIVAVCFDKKERKKRVP